MKTRALSLFVLLLGVELTAQNTYWPGRWREWEKIEPAEVGFDEGRLDAAIAFAKQSFDPEGGFDPSREPYGETRGDHDRTLTRSAALRQRRRPA